MATDLATPASARPDLIIRPHEEQGAYVVKDPRSGAYYHLGEEEHFLLTQLDGGRDFAAVAAAFAGRFGQPLPAEDFDEFLALARKQGLLVPEGALLPAPVDARPAAPPRTRGNFLFWRVRVVDPDRLFTHVAPALWFLWTPGFLVLSALSIATAAGVLWSNRLDTVSHIAGAVSWQTAVRMWLTWVVVIVLHECAHGLTCKHYGGEVHEIGFLLIVFMPCFYCNVSDAWLFRRKAHRLWVTLAGAYFELFVWSLAVFAWRLAPAGTLLHELTLVIVAACGVRTLFNLNPLIKLDGYYLLSDWAEVPNLQQRSSAYVLAQLRRLLWGAGPPEAEPRGRFLLVYGVASLLFTLFLMLLMLTAVVKLAGSRWGWLSAGLMLGLAGWSMRGLMRGLSAGEITKMMQFRRKRAVVAALVPVLAVCGLCWIEVEDRAGGAFVLRAAARTELRAPVAGFLHELTLDEGEAVQEGQVVARLEIPDLSSRTTQKASEVQEAHARLKLLRGGTRPEEVRAQEERVGRARVWRDRARDDLTQARKTLVADLVRLHKQIEQYEANLGYADDLLLMDHKLVQTGAATSLEVKEAMRQRKVAHAQIEQTRAQIQSRETLGNQEAETELARREKELADAQALLTVMKAAPQADAIQAEEAHVARLEEELRYLSRLPGKLVIASPHAGVISTPHLKEKRGQYMKEGDLICLIEDPSEIEAEIALAEEECTRVRPGQPISLKVRSLPFETYASQVLRSAPAVHADASRPAGSGEAPGIVSIYCRLSNETGTLRSGMNGYARIAAGRRSVSGYLLDRIQRLVRTEFWW
jgi:multidrug efflux pump subunit AcrA (membrane-fusion protein)